MHVQNLAYLLRVQIVVSAVDWLAEIGKQGKAAGSVLK